MGCRVSSIHVAGLQGLTVVLGVISVLLLADAIFDDHKFFKLKLAVSHHNKTLNVSSINWTQKEKNYHRGGLDWILISALISVILAHTIFLLLLFHEISNGRREHSAAQQQRVSIRHLSVHVEERVQETEVVTPQPIDPNQIQVEESDSINQHPPDGIPATDNSPRKMIYKPTTFLFGAVLIGLFGLFLAGRICLEFHLIKQLGLFYNEEDRNGQNLTWPFPGWCAITKMKELGEYEASQLFRKSDFKGRGAYNNHIMKLTSATLSIIVAILTLTITVLYWFRHKKLTNQVTWTEDQKRDKSNSFLPVLVTTITTI